MRIDLPQCGFKNCRYCFDGNCTSEIEFGMCEFINLASKEYRYSWHNLRKNPEDLPNVYKYSAYRILWADCHQNYICGGFYDSEGQYVENDAEIMYEPVAWKYIDEPFEKE